MNSESNLVIRPARSVTGTLRLPGDKSISHRYAMLGAIAEGTTRLSNYSTGRDCASTLACMRALGAGVQKNEDGTIEIRGCGAALKRPAAPLDCGNSGSTIRMLSGILAGQQFTAELVGDESLSRRPMARIIKPLTSMGAKISAAAGDRPPLYITGGGLKAIDYGMPVVSAQVKTSVLFAGLFAEGETRVVEPIKTRDHGELALAAFGAEVKRDGLAARIRGRQPLRGIEASIPGDISSAAFFLCAAALFPDSELTISGLLMNPTRARLLDFMVQLGARISVTELEEHHGELVGTVQIRGGILKGMSIASADTAALIDEIPVLAAIAPYTRDGLEVRDARELRVKESDRIAVLAANLRAMGAELEEWEDGLRIPGGQALHGAQVESHGDHRIAMAFAIAALRARGETEIRGAEGAAVSYPAFFSALESIAIR